MKCIYFLYINIFAFLLIGLGVVIFIMPQDIFLFILKIIFAFSIVASGFGILFQWKTKSRRLKILIARNKRGIRLDTFKQIREYPCGWVMADVALRELRKTENHRSFSGEQWKDIRRTVLGIKNWKGKCFT